MSERLGARELNGRGALRLCLVAGPENPNEFVHRFRSLIAISQANTLVGEDCDFDVGPATTADEQASHQDAPRLMDVYLAQRPTS